MELSACYLLTLVFGSQVLKMISRVPLRLSSCTLLNIKTVSHFKPMRFSTFVQSKKTQIIQTPQILKIQVLAYFSIYLCLVKSIFQQKI
jgi:hypothetical protein